MKLWFWYQQKIWSLLVECTWRLFCSLHGKKTTKNLWSKLSYCIIFYSKHCLQILKSLVSKTSEDCGFLVNPMCSNVYFCNCKFYISFFQSFNVKVVSSFHAHEKNHTHSWKHSRPHMSIELVALVMVFKQKKNRGSN